MVRLLSTAILLPLILVSALNAQALEKRHALGLRFGTWNLVTDTRTSVTTDGVSTSVGNNGVVGAVAYNYWMQENLALDISVGGMTPDISTEIDLGGVTSSTGTVGYVLMGVKYYLPASTYASSVRPYGLVAVGSYIGHQTETTAGWEVLVESGSQTAFGGKLAAGVDFPVSRHFIAGVAAGYNFMTDFDEPVGGSDNYSGPEFVLGFGFLFGSGVY